MTYRKQHEYYLDYKEYNMIMTSHIPHALQVYTRHHDSAVNRYEISVSIPLSLIIIVLLTKVARWLTPMKQELLSLPEHMS
jgi:hypothetical protein